MRVTSIAIATAVLGSLTGLGLTYYEVVSVEDRFEASYGAEVTDGSASDTTMAGRAVVVGESVFDFGSLEQNSTGTCTFTVRNEADVPMAVDLEGVSCGLCIETDLSQFEVQTTEEYMFNVTYTTQKDDPEFSEYVEMRTSDPNNTVIRFNITGYVTRLVRFSKSEIAFGSISAGEDVSTDFRIYGFADEPIMIVGHEFTSQRSADDFKLELTPLDRDEFKNEEPRAKSAVQARLSMMPGKQLGPVNQVLHITAQMGEKATEAELTIRGKIVSDIMLIGGSDFDNDKNLVRMRSIPSAVGHSTTLRVHVRGPYRDEVKLTVGTIDPADVLTATIGEPTIVKNGYLYPVKITIPKGASSVDRLGSQQGKVGLINIETTHPSAKQVPIYVSFAVE